MPHCPPELNQASPFLDRRPHTDELYTPPDVGILQSSDHVPVSLPQGPACQATPQKLPSSPAQHTAPVVSLPPLSRDTDSSVDADIDQEPAKTHRGHLASGVLSSASLLFSDLTGQAPPPHNGGESLAVLAQRAKRSHQPARVSSTRTGISHDVVTS